MRIRLLLRVLLPPNRWSDFWDAAKAGELAEVQRYVSGGQAPDETKMIAGAPYTALMLATMNGHARVVKFLVLSGADPSRRDRYGRTVLHATTVGERRSAPPTRYFG